MGTTTNTPGEARDDAPIASFSQCHVGILSHLTAFGSLPRLLEPAVRARNIAEDTLGFFQDVVLEHHAEEERELFPAVLASAAQGDELARVKSIVERLTREHRQVESTWAKLKPQVKKIARGETADLDTSAVEALVRDYGAHAAFEEAEFLPLCQAILGRNSNHMAALGLSLHMRHVPPAVGHI